MYILRSWAFLEKSPRWAATRELLTISCDHKFQYRFHKIEIHSFNPLDTTQPHLSQTHFNVILLSYGLAFQVISFIRYRT
jgi:hypothetical protein